MNVTEEAKADTAAGVILHDIESGKRFLLPCSRPAICFFLCVWVLAKLNCAILHCCVYLVCLFVCWFVCLVSIFNVIFFFDWGLSDDAQVLLDFNIGICLCVSFLDGIRLPCCSRGDRDQGRYNFQFGIEVFRVGKHGNREPQPRCLVARASTNDERDGRS